MTTTDPEEIQPLIDEAREYLEQIEVVIEYKRYLNDLMTRMSKDKELLDSLTAGTYQQSGMCGPFKDAHNKQRPVRGPNNLKQKLVEWDPNGRRTWEESKALYGKSMWLDVNKIRNLYYNDIEYKREHDRRYKTGVEEPPRSFWDDMSGSEDLLRGWNPMPYDITTGTWYEDPEPSIIHQPMPIRELYERLRLDNCLIQEGATQIIRAHQILWPDPPPNIAIQGMPVVWNRDIPRGEIVVVHVRPGEWTWNLSPANPVGRPHRLRILAPNGQEIELGADVRGAYRRIMEGELAAMRAECYGEIRIPINEMRAWSNNVTDAPNEVTRESLEQAFNACEGTSDSQPPVPDPETSEADEECPPSDSDQ
jgi:hypothetical protein